MSRRGFIHRALRTLAAAALAASAMPAWAGDFPDHPIRWLVPFSAGGGSDLATRIVAKHVSQTLGQPVVVENGPAPPPSWRPRKPRAPRPTAIR
ncbi:hypothetical protein WJ966_25075 [Achromobacter xylosoxidans]